MNLTDIQDVLHTFPDKVAVAQAKWKTAVLDREHLGAKLYLQIKAQAESNNHKMPVDEIKARVKVDAGYYQACMDEIVAESEYTAIYEKLLAAKREAGIRAAF